MLTHPEILYIGRGDGAVLYAYCLGCSLGTFHFGLCVEFLGLKIGLGLFNLDFAVLLSFGKLCLAFHYKKHDAGNAPQYTLDYFRCDVDVVVIIHSCQI